MNKTREWWEDFFPGPWGDLQAQGYPQEKTHAEVDFLVAALELSEGDRVLDLACGIGRHTVELAIRGFDATGLDFNGAALALAQKAASEHGVSPRFVCRDMRQHDACEAIKRIPESRTNVNAITYAAWSKVDPAHIAPALGITKWIRLTLRTKVLETMSPQAHKMCVKRGPR